MKNIPKTLKKLTKSDKRKHLSRWLLIALLAAGLVSLLGGSYLTLFYTSRKPSQTATNSSTVNQTTTAETTSTSQSKEEEPNLARLGVILDNQLSLSYPLSWQHKPEGIWPKIIFPLKDYKAQTLMQLADESSKINLSINRYTLADNFTFSQFAEKFNEALEANGFKIIKAQPSESGNLFRNDILLSNNNLNYRLYYQLIFAPIQNHERQAYLVAAASLEKDFLDNLAELSNLLNSLRLK